MSDEPYIAEAASLIGDPARANMLSALMSGRAATATELSAVAGVSAATASAHLGKLVAGGLLVVEKQGRHRYFRLAGPEVAQALEALSALSQRATPRMRRPGPRDAEMRRLRTCYDHLAGEIAVGLVDRWLALGWLEEGEDAFTLTEAGEAAFEGLGIPIAPLAKSRRAFAKRCLDWSERRAHLGGALGAAVLSRFQATGWIARPKTGRTAKVTEAGRAAFATEFGLDLDAFERAA
ncbi:MAG: helix-turn-helix domain-containing protein [Pseudomonadota bacterium]